MTGTGTGAERITGGQGGHHPSSLAKAERKARRAIRKVLPRNTCDHLKPGDFRIAAAYSGGRFRRA